MESQSNMERYSGIELKTAANVSLPDFSKINWIEHGGHNGDFKTFFKINGQWYEVDHDDGSLTDAIKTTEADVRQEFETLAKDGRLIPADQFGAGKPYVKLHPGKRKMEMLDADVGSWQDNESMFTMGDDAETPVSPTQVAQWVNDGTFSAEMAKAHGYED